MHGWSSFKTDGHKCYVINFCFPQIESLKIDLGKKDAALTAAETKLETLQAHQSNQQEHISILQTSLSAKEQRIKNLQGDVRSTFHDNYYTCRNGLFKDLLTPTWQSPILFMVVFLSLIHHKLFWQFIRRLATFCRRDNNNNNNNNNNSLFTFPFLYNITMFSIFRKREEKLDSYKDTKI